MRAVFLSAFTSGAWLPLLEVALIAVVFYLVLHFLRGKILRGLVLVYVVGFFLLSFASHQLGLGRIEYVLQQLFGLTVLAILVIFQPELRRGLMSLGGSIPTLLGAKKPTSRIDSLVEAVEWLSQRRIGAIIAIQREESLAQYTEGGTRLNSEITAPLVQTVFMPSTPLHDGAIIIQGNRIAAAGCLLPLTDNVNLSKALGTRHRAAIGLTEDTDAVSIVVSEETGAISVGVKGDLLQKLSPEDLRSILKDLCAPRPEEAAAAIQMG